MHFRWTTAQVHAVSDLSVSNEAADREGWVVTASRARIKSSLGHDRLEALLGVRSWVRNIASYARDSVP